MKIIKNQSSTGKIAKQISNSAKKVLRVRKPVNVNDLIPTPCIPFNLECSGHIEGAFQKGKIVNLIGDSHAGKTLFALSIFAECSLLPAFDTWRFINDDVEAACEFDTAYLFGDNCHSRIEGEEQGIRSNTFEDFESNIEKALVRAEKNGEPFIYILDSADALDTEAAIVKHEENMSAREKGNKEKGSYGDGKAALFSAFFKHIKQRLYDCKSLLIVISQTRDNLGFGAKFTPKVRSGGKALKFYSAHEIWLSMMKKDKKGDRTYSTDVMAKVSKNKLTGRHGVAYFPILFDHGIDYIQSCIYFLLNENYWAGNKTSVSTKGWCKIEDPKTGKVTYNKLIEYVENNNLENDLAMECKIAYDGVIEKMTPSHRKFRYQRA